MFPTDEPRPFMHLEIGGRYEVILPFTDYDGVVHPTGENWTFLTHDFLPYVEGLQLYVRHEREGEVTIRLQWMPEAQGAIIDQLERYVQPIDRGVSP